MSTTPKDKRAANLVRTEMVRQGLTYKQLARRLEAQGVELSGAKLSNKLNRGTFSATFLLQCLRALDVEVLRIYDAEVEGLKSRE